MNTLSNVVAPIGASAGSYSGHVSEYLRLAEVAQQAGGLVVIWSDEHHGFVLVPVPVTV